MSIASPMDTLQTQIERTSRVSAAVLVIVLIAAPVLAALYAASSFAAGHPWLTADGVAPPALTPSVRLALLAAMLANMLPLLWGLVEARRLFRSYAGGGIFTEYAAARFGRFALALALTGMAGPVAALALSAALSWLGATVPSLAILVSSTDILLVLLGGMLWIIAAALRGAARIAEENASFF